MNIYSNLLNNFAKYLHLRVGSMTCGLPLIARADACRTARHSLALIATARPPAFVITMAKEVARYNTLAQNAQAHHHSQIQQLHNSVLVRGRPEILHVVELLVEKIPNDVADLLIEVFYLKIKCNVFSFVEVNFSTSIFNINKSI